MKMRKSSDQKILEDYEKGQLASVAPSKSELKKFKEAARATFIDESVSTSSFRRKPESRV